MTEYYSVNREIKGGIWKVLHWFWDRTARCLAAEMTEY